MRNESKVKIEIFRLFSRVIAESKNLEVLSNRLVRLIASALQIKGCTIFCLGPESKELEVLATFGLNPTYLIKGPVLADKSMAATLEGRTVIVPDVTKESAAQYPEAAKKEGISAIISVPIVFPKEVVGTLRLYHHEVWNPSEEDVDSLQMLAANIGLAIGYSRLLTAVQSISEVLGSSLLESELS